MKVYNEYIGDDRYLGWIRRIRSERLRMMDGSTDDTNLLNANDTRLYCMYVWMYNANIATAFSILKKHR